VGGPSINLEERGGDRGECADVGATVGALGGAMGIGADTGVDRDMFPFVFVRGLNRGL